MKIRCQVSGIIGVHYEIIFIKDGIKFFPGLLWSGDFFHISLRELVL